MITIFERIRRYLSLRPALTESFQRALPKKIQDISLFMSGAHGDIYAVFDYAVDTLHEDKLRGDDARWSEQGADEEQAVSSSHSDDDSGNALTDDTSPRSIKRRTLSSGVRTHRASASVPIPRDRPLPDRSGGERSFPRSRTLPTTSPIPAAALHAIDTDRREITSAGILASSPEKRFDPLRPHNRPRSLVFESRRDLRRASYPPVEPHAHHDGNVENAESPQSILERGRTGGDGGQQVRGQLPPSHEGVRSSEPGIGEVAEDAGAPLWAGALLNSLKRLEERQERLEEMLMPSEGD